ncbi:MAG: hypothetical protein K2P85_05495, partial [Flavobacteriaceae bacterium]|nr:hypothetical protein [Flavobacteriaceae bacterium]
AKVGMGIIDLYGYQMNWLFMGILGLIGTGLGFWVIQLVAQEKLMHPEIIHPDVPATFEHPAEGGEREI